MHPLRCASLTGYGNVLLVVSLFVVFPPIETLQTAEKTVQLPVGIARIPTEIFDPASLSILTCVIIAYCSAHAQALHVQLFNRTILGTPSLSRECSIRDWHDALRLHSVLRVASLSELIPSKWVKVKCSYRFLLKTLSLIVTFAPATVALAFAVRRYCRIEVTGYSIYIRYVVLLLAAAAAVPLLQLILYEITLNVKREDEEKQSGTDDTNADSLAK